jgi:hypothetical protein
MTCLSTGATTRVLMRPTRHWRNHKGTPVPPPPIRYVVELFDVDADSERAIGRLTVLMVLCYDLLAVVLTAAASTRRSTATHILDPAVIRNTAASVSLLRCPTSRSAVLAAPWHGRI